MEVQFLDKGRAQTVLAELARSCDSMQWAVAWARPKSLVLDAAYKYKAKFSRLLIGTHFHQTDPGVLRRFSTVAFARMMLPKGDTFHPKVYLFQTGTQVTAVVGSHNLTPKAFAGNSEMSVRLDAPASHPEMQRLQDFIRKEWLRAESIEKKIDAYELQHKLKQRHLQELEAFNEDIAPPDPRSDKPSPFTLSWADFLRHAKGDRHGIDGRLRVLARARLLFEKKASLSAMSSDERKAIAATYHAGEKVMEDLPWAWFGSMSGNGDFAKLVNESRTLWMALDAIPLEGVVERQHFTAFAKQFKRAFTASGAQHVGDLPTASRLLAMKRPDTFVGVNSKNRRALCWAMGMPYTTLNLSNYWERVISKLPLCPWWVQQAPHAGQARAIWDGRAALLDCIYYVPDNEAA